MFLSEKVNLAVYLNANINNIQNNQRKENLRNLNQKIKKNSKKIFFGNLNTIFKRSYMMSDDDGDEKKGWSWRNIKFFKDEEERKKEIEDWKKEIREWKKQNGIEDEETDEELKDNDNSDFWRLSDDNSDLKNVTSNISPPNPENNINRSTLPIEGQPNTPLIQKVPDRIEENFFDNIPSSVYHPKNDILNYYQWLDNFVENLLNIFWYNPTNLLILFYFISIIIVTYHNWPSIIRFFRNIFIGTGSYAGPINTETPPSSNENQEMQNVYNRLLEDLQQIRNQAESLQSQSESSELNQPTNNTPTEDPRLIEKLKSLIKFLISFIVGRATSASAGTKLDKTSLGRKIRIIIWIVDVLKRYLVKLEKKVKK